MPRLADLLSEFSDKQKLDDLARKAHEGHKTKTSGPRGTSRSQGVARPPRKRSIPDFVALDLETTGLNSRSDRITEIGAVKFIGGKQTERFSTLVNPGIPIPEEITRLTGITNIDVATAPAFNEISDAVAAFVGTLPICGHQIEFDISFLNAMLRAQNKPLFTNQPLDTAALSRIVVANLPGYSLGAVAAHLGIVLENAHRALDDAIASGYVAVTLIPRLVEIPHDVRRALANFAPRSMLKKMIIDSLGEGKQEKAQPDKDKAPRSWPKLVPYDPEMTVTTQSVTGILDDTGPMTSHVAGFVPRPAQQEMAKAVAQSLNDHTFLVAEAGTGTGKSLAYLIPAGLFALTHNCRILVSTHTRNLQDQLASKDLPVVAAAIGRGLRFSVLKGRGNYLCRRKFEMLLAGALTHLSIREREGLLPLIRWAGQTTTGDIEEQRQFNRNWHQRIWNQIAADSHDCTGYRCRHYGECFLQQARRKAQTSHIVIINHSLFFSEICAGSPFLNHQGPVIFDEAHHLQSTGHQCLRVVVDTNRLNLFAERAASVLARVEKSKDAQAFHDQEQQFKKILKSVRLSSRRLCDDLAVWAKAQGPQGNGNYQIPAVDRPFAGFATLAGLTLELELFTNLIHDWTQKLLAKDNGDEPDPLGNELNGLSAQLSQLKADLNYVTRAEMEDHVFWLEGNHEKGWVKLSGVPLDVGALLRPYWQRQDAGMVFTSATLSVAGSVEFFASQIGLDMTDDSRAQSLLVPSPFGAHQSLRLAVADAPGPNEPGFGTFCSAAIARLVVATARSTLVLFTSNALLEDVYKKLSADESVGGHKIFAQGIAGSRQTILEAFKNNPGSVLLGTSSFWEGIDVPGQTCELVIIPRLPFTVPTEPLAQALAENARKVNGESFFSFSVPEAVIRFRQGAGRLIRTIDDKGALVILDNRIVTKGYGKAFSRSLDGGVEKVANFEQVIAQVQTFFKSTTPPDQPETLTYVPMDAL